MVFICTEERIYWDEQTLLHGSSGEGFKSSGLS